MNKGYSDVLIGLQYGDEGKARIIDTIADDYDVIARFNGGSNAGHTIETASAKISLHQVPSGIFYGDKILYVGSGCVVNPVKLVSEINDIHAAGASLDGRFHISSLASIVQPHHVLLDQMTGSAIGTTGQGIGPAYSDRALRMKDNRTQNIRTDDLVADPDNTFKIIRQNLEAVLLEHRLPDYPVQAIMDEFISASHEITKYVQADTLFMSKQVERGARVLFEGAQSFMLDVVKGAVPFVTSSSTLAGAAYVGGDVPPSYHRKTIGVAKAIMSRVGMGPFVSEFGGARSEDYCADKSNTDNAKSHETGRDIEKLLASDDPFDVGVALRVLGHEYGATTGRPRRIGCLDLVQLSYAVKANGVDELYINKCDLLKDYARTAQHSMPVVTAYLQEGRKIDYVPASAVAYRRISPVIDRFSVFSGEISEARSKEQLPPELNNLISSVENCACPVRGVGVGPRRDQFVLLAPHAKG